MTGTPDLEVILDVLSRACLGDTEARVAVDPELLDDPLAIIGNALNVLLDDLAYRQREREEALRRVSALQAKEEFLAYLSHDMQTPMAVLIGAVTVLESSTSREDVEATLPLMQQAIERLQRFVRQFLDLARLEADRPLTVHTGPVDVASVARRVVGLLGEVEPVEVTVEPGVPPARADAERVEQILTNLLTNAQKYAGNPQVSVTAADDGAAVDVTVADEGPGMDGHELERVFGKFERGGSATGTGLGLFLSRALAEAQGGSLTATSESGVGSRFTLRLPAHVSGPDVLGSLGGDADGAGEPG